jgi:hypothetical protein
MFRSHLALILGLATLFVANVSFAQNYKLRAGQKQTLNFEDELVEGSAQKPELFYLFQKKNFNYTRLIKLRENFLPEMRKTSEDIQRLRGGR